MASPSESPMSQKLNTLFDAQLPTREFDAFDARPALRLNHPADTSADAEWADFEATLIKANPLAAFGAFEAGRLAELDEVQMPVNVALADLPDVSVDLEPVESNLQKLMAWIEPNALPRIAVAAAALLAVSLPGAMHQAIGATPDRTSSAQVGIAAPDLDAEPYDTMLADLRAGLPSQVAQIDNAQELATAISRDLGRLGASAVVQAEFGYLPGQDVAELGIVGQPFRIAHVSATFTEGQTDRDLAAFALVLGRYMHAYQLDVPSAQFYVDPVGNIAPTEQLALDSKKAEAMYAGLMDLPTFLAGAAL